MVLDFCNQGYAFTIGVVFGMLVLLMFIIFSFAINNKRKK